MRPVASDSSSLRCYLLTYLTSARPVGQSLTLRVGLPIMKPDLLRRTSYPTSGYSLGTRGRRRPSRRLRTPARRGYPIIRPIIVIVVLLLGSRAFRLLQNQHEIQPVAATAHTATPHPAAATRPVATPRATPTPPPTPAPIPSALPQVQVPLLSSSCLPT